MSLHSTTRPLSWCDVTIIQTPEASWMFNVFLMEGDTVAKFFKSVLANNGIKLYFI